MKTVTSCNVLSMAEKSFSCSMWMYMRWKQQNLGMVCLGKYCSYLFQPSNPSIVSFYLLQFHPLKYREMHSCQQFIRYWLKCNSGFCLNFVRKILVQAIITFLHWNLVLSGIGIALTNSCSTCFKTRFAMTNSSSGLKSGTDVVENPVPVMASSKLYLVVA